MADVMISNSTAEWLRFGLGVMVTAGLFVATRQLRERQSPFVAALMESRMQYAAAGFVLGFFALPSIADGVTHVVPLATTLIVGWFGFAVGCGIDLRAFRRRARARLYTEGVQVLLAFGLLAVGLYILKSSSAATAQPRSWPEVLLILAICMVGSGRRRREAVGGRQAGIEQPGLSVSSLAAILLAGLAGSLLSPGSFSIDYPFAAGRDLLIGGLVDEAIFSVALGVALGVAANLICRDTRPELLFYVLTGVLLLGCGIANSLSLESLWVGLVAGAWLINGTLRRVDLIDTLDVGRRNLPLIVLFLAGWLIGSTISPAFQWDLFLWVVTFVVLIRPLARLLGIRFAVTLGRETSNLGREPGPRRLSKVGSRVPASADVDGSAGEVESLDVFRIGDLALVIAVGCARLMGTEQGLGVLAGVLVGYVISRIAGGAASGLLVRIFSVGPTR